MNGVLLCRRPASLWQKEYFPDVSPYMLPVLGKPLIEFYLDYCSLSGVKDVLILQEDLDSEACDYIGNGGRWGLNVEMSRFPDGKDSEEKLRALKKLLGASESLVLDGFFFPYYDRSSENKISLKKFDCGRPISGSIDGLSSAVCECLEIPDLNSYHELNMRLIREGDDRLIMCGYSGERGVHMGMNDVVKNNATLSAPLIIGNNVRIEYGCKVGNGAIIGNSCIVDLRTRVENSIIFDKTYVGVDLDLSGKIVNGGDIIDPKSGVSVSFSDAFFASSMEYNQANEIVKRMFAECFAASIFLSFLVMSVPFLLTGFPKSEILELPNFAGRPCRIRRYIKSDRISDIRFFKLSLDKLPLLWATLKWRIALIGDTPLDAERDAKIILRYRGRYRAGAFSYSDSIGERTLHEKVIDDLYYSRNRNWFTDVKLILKSLIGRLFYSGSWRATKDDDEAGSGQKK